jgi:multisubunit Na+/H+ antiporter MnhE subunit
MWLVFASGMQPVLAGTAVGVLFAAMFSLGLVASLRNAPIPLRITNPIPYAVVCTALITSAMVAMLRHARRAAAIEPLTALREE